MSENHGVVFMVSLKKIVPCKCGANNSFDFSSDMSVDDLTLSARCPSCGASVCISISSLLSAPAQVPPDALPTVQIADPSPAADTQPDENSAESVEQVVRDLLKK
jgi:hypothetical protein